MDSWSERFDAARWWQALAEAEIDWQTILHEPYELGAALPWDHIHLKPGRAFLEKEHLRSIDQLAAMDSP